MAPGEVGDRRGLGDFEAQARGRYAAVANLLDDEWQEFRVIQRLAGEIYVEAAKTGTRPSPGPAAA